MKRKAGKKDADKYDVRKVYFHKKVRRNYHEIGKKLGKKWKIVDASKSIEEVHKETLGLLKRYKIM
jgi:thymidylate kinase